jgi:hypothetical protein
MKKYGVRYVDHGFLNSALVGGEWPASCRRHFTPPEKEPQVINWIRGWVGPRAGVNNPFIGQPVACHYLDCTIPTLIVRQGEKMKTVMSLCG